MRVELRALKVVGIFRRRETECDEDPLSDGPREELRTGTESSNVGRKQSVQLR